MSRNCSVFEGIASLGNVPWAACVVRDPPVVVSWTGKVLLF